MNPSFLFYDIETTGLNPCFDQILQFAAIRTDCDLKEIERHEIIVRLRPDVIPHPEALLVHQIDIETMQQGLPEEEAIVKIHQLLNQPGTISLGYNTLGFDDDFLRFGFYRNLLTPYTHQYANQCKRMDVYPMTLIYALFQKEVLTWPIIEGKLSLKLEHLNAQNQWLAGPAHQAMTDVEVTVCLSKALQKQRKIWDYLLTCFDKGKDMERLNKLPIACQQNNKAYSKALLIQGKLGHREHYQAPVLGLGKHAVYTNQFCFLRLDHLLFSEVSPSSFENELWVMNKKIAEQEIILPLVDQYSSYLSQERLEKTEYNINWLRKNPDFLETVEDHYLHRTYPQVPNIDCEAALYDIGFPSREDSITLNQFHQALSLEQKRQIASRFEQVVYQQLAQRLLNRMEGKFNISPSPRIDYQGRTALSKEEALQYIASRDITQLSDSQKNILKNYKNYLVDLA